MAMQCSMTPQSQARLLLAQEMFYASFNDKAAAMLASADAKATTMCDHLLIGREARAKSTALASDQSRAFFEVSDAAYTKAEEAAQSLEDVRELAQEAVLNQRRSAAGKLFDRAKALMN